MTSRRYPSHQWLVIHQFSSYEDAKAFQALVEEQFGNLQSLMRPKGQYESAGNVAAWRMTHILRKELSGNSFGRELLQIACQTNGFTAKSAISWLQKAITHGVVQRLGKGIYEFLPLPTGAVAAPDLGTILDLQCAACQPEPLQCQS